MHKEPGEPGREHGDYTDDVAFTASNGDFASFTFTGAEVTYISPKASDQGDVEVFIDDVSQGIFSKTGLAHGSHTFEGG